MTDNAKLNRFLLGMLSEDEIDAINDAAIVDDDVATRLAMLEDEMIDAYVRDELDADTKARIEATLLRSEYGQERVAVARSLIARADRQPVERKLAEREPVVREPEPANVAPFQSHGRDPKRGTWLAIAAAALLSIAALYLVGALGTDETPNVSTSTMVIALAPTVRGTSAVPRIKLEPTTEALRLEIDLEGVDLEARDRLTVRLFGPQGSARFVANGLVPTFIVGTPALIVEVPRSPLEHGRHVLAVHRGDERIGQFELDIFNVEE